VKFHVKDVNVYVFEPFIGLVHRETGFWQ